jgi:hypothetical protein
MVARQPPPARPAARSTPLTAAVPRRSTRSTSAASAASGTRWTGSSWSPSASEPSAAPATRLQRCSRRRRLQAACGLRLRACRPARPGCRRFCGTVSLPHEFTANRRSCNGRCLDGLTKKQYPQEYEPPC